VLRPDIGAGEEFRARFRSEVNRAREVPPFCTAEVLDADPDHATPYLVVEYVDGPTLSEVVAENGPLTGGSLHGVAVGVATALAAIHGAGVIHRDLKPRNVLFALGAPKVIDFGIARALEATSHHTRTEEMVGTLAYMAPERFDPATDRNLTPAADIFAWGAVVTYAGTGRTPFTGDVPTVTAARILTAAPVLDGLPEPLAGVVALALAKARSSARPPTSCSTCCCAAAPAVPDRCRCCPTCGGPPRPRGTSRMTGLHAYGAAAAGLPRPLPCSPWPPVSSSRTSRTAVSTPPPHRPPRPRRRPQRRPARSSSTRSRGRPSGSRCRTPRVPAATTPAWS
jgi:serine/threonine protein kinase